MTVLSMDLNAGRARAVSGPVGDFAFTVPLQPPHDDLPLVLNLEGKTPTVGISGVRICRELPHAVYQNFLPNLGEIHEDPVARPMQHHSVNGEQALHKVFEYLRPITSRYEGLVLSMPPYLGSHQIFLIKQIIQEHRLPLLSTAINPLAIALAAFAEHNWKGNAIVLDVDEHALWLAWLREEKDKVHLVKGIAYPHLGLARWKKKLLNTLADLCIQDSRKDPRHYPCMEQSLYLQLDSVMEDCASNRMSNVAFQKANWYHHLVLEPDQIAGFFTSFVRPVLADISALLERHIPQGEPKAILVSAQGSVLPGLVDRVEEYLEVLNCRQKPQKLSVVEEEDFGENLLDGGEFDDTPKLIQLSPDAAPRGAHLLAELWDRGEIADEHLDRLAPLPALLAVDAGPARLQFQGREFLLSERPFTVGRRHDCHLVLDKTRYPHISPWHCEILYDPRRYLLRDFSREGTWINDRPVTQMTVLVAGDWIRLGLKGPVLRFLGQPENRTWITTA
jgi:hypothetical protein